MQTMVCDTETQEQCEEGELIELYAARPSVHARSVVELPRAEATDPRAGEAAAQADLVTIEINEGPYQVSSRCGFK
jgi:hypothetical protein